MLHLRWQTTRQPSVRMYNESCDSDTSYARNPVTQPLKVEKSRC